MNISNLNYFFLKITTNHIEFIIIYPDGKSERSRTMENIIFYEDCFSDHNPCWDAPQEITCPWEALRKMKQYAKDNGFERVFVGEV